MLQIEQFSYQKLHYESARRSLSDIYSCSAFITEDVTACVIPDEEHQPQGGTEEQR